MVNGFGNISALSHIDGILFLCVQRAVESKLKPEDMIKTLFIFSDMEFDEATSRTPDYHSRYLGQYGTSDDGSDGDGSEVVTLYQNLSLGGQKHVTSKRTSTNYETVKVSPSSNCILRCHSAATQSCCSLVRNTAADWGAQQAE